MKPSSASKSPEKLVDAQGLLNEIFDESSRPKIRWLRKQQEARTIPFVKIGRFVRFDVAAVREALTTKFTVQPRSSGGAS